MTNYYRAVFDLGQFLSKIGFGSEPKPRETFFTITGKLKYKGLMLDQEAQDQLFVGNKIFEKIGLYKINHPLGKGGEIQDWGEFRAIIDHAFTLLGVSPEKCQILYAANPFLSIESHKRLAELFLKDLRVGGYYPIRNAILSMYSGGFDTGLIVDIGANYTRITPIYKSFILKHALKIIPLGGNDLDSFMKIKLNQKAIHAWSKGGMNKVRLLKERGCFTSQNFDQDIQTPEKFQKEMSFPDSSKITIDVERFLVPELLFQPKLGENIWSFQAKLRELGSFSLVSGIISAINDCDVDIRPDLLKNIYLTGGTASIPLLHARVKLEIEKEFKNKEKISSEIRVVAAKESLFSNWAGGSFLSMIPEFQQNWMTLKSYNENGLPEDILSY